MEVGAKNILVHCSLETILAVITPADNNSSEWLSIWAKVGASAVVFVTDQYSLPSLLKIALECHVGHKSRITTFGIEIKQSYSFEFRSLKRLIVVPKKLESRTYTQEYCI